MEKIKEIVKSFKTYDELYQLIVDFNYDVKNVLFKKLDTNEYPELDLMIEYFIKKEDFEKVIILRHIQKTL
jgi:hypothetical protein